MGMEAMAEVFMALAETNEPPLFEQVRFERPVVIGGWRHQQFVSPRSCACSGLCGDRLAQETGFQADHFRAVCRVGVAPLQPAQRAVDIDTRVMVQPEHDLYGRVLFHGGRFRVFASIARSRPQSARPRSCPTGRPHGSAGISQVVWCSAIRALATQQSMPSGVRTADHAPAGRRREITGSLNGQTGGLIVRAQEREHLANGFMLRRGVDRYRRTCERWERLHCAPSAARNSKVHGREVLTPYVERYRFDSGASVSVAFERDPDSSTRRDRSTRAIESALGDGGIIRRADGNQKLATDDVSASHCGDLTMAVAGHSPSAAISNSS